MRHLHSMIHRRNFFRVLGAALPAGLLVQHSFAATNGKKTVKIVEFDAAGLRTGVVDAEKVEKPAAEWKKQLTAQQYKITREADTEYPGTGKYASFHGDGVYHCICCDTALFDSKTKFESGTGWPSFYQPIAKENVYTKHDTSAGMIRDETACSRCDAHLGHVFDDGPPPTHLRYCMNSGALNFVARAKQQSSR